MLERFAVEIDPALRRVAIQYDEPLIASAVLTVDDVEIMAIPTDRPVLGSAFVGLEPELFTRRLRVTVTLQPEVEP
jgi:hypothetical protein